MNVALYSCHVEAAIVAVDAFLVVDEFNEVGRKHHLLIFCRRDSAFNMLQQTSLVGTNRHPSFLPRDAPYCEASCSAGEEIPLEMDTGEE
jgi:hypothetical protein